VYRESKSATRLQTAHQQLPLLVDHLIGGRAGQVSDIVNGILFLEASPFVTGEIVYIDGGRIAGH
jgi:NAD(P)-dependent dehydrogenase (short-subunit alcohol dehydrogenase family)